MSPSRITLVRTVAILAGVAVAVLLTGQLTTLGAMLMGVLVVLGAEVLLFTHRS